MKQAKDALANLGKWGERVFCTMRTYFGDGLGRGQVDRIAGDLREWLEYARAEGIGVWHVWNWDQLERIPALVEILVGGIRLRQGYGGQAGGQVDRAREIEMVADRLRLNGESVLAASAALLEIAGKMRAA